MQDAKLRAACNGATRAKGGYNVPDLMAMAKKRGAWSGERTRRDLLRVLCMVPQRRGGNTRTSTPKKRVQFATPIQTVRSFTKEPNARLVASCKGANRRKAVDGDYGYNVSELRELALDRGMDNVGARKRDELIAYLCRIDASLTDDVMGDRLDYGKDECGKGEHGKDECGKDECGKDDETTHAIETSSWSRVLQKTGAPPLRISEDVVMQGTVHAHGTTYDYYFVADGHGSNEWIEYRSMSHVVERRFESVLARNLKRVPKGAVHSALQGTVSELQEVSLRAGDVGVQTGTTLVGLLADRASGSGWVLNIGDSAAAWGSNGKGASQITVEHTALQEQAEVRRRHCTIWRDRVEGRFAFSRSIGDNSDRAHCLGRTADIYDIDLATVDWMVIASDGLWDLSDDDAYDGSMGALAADVAWGNLSKLAEDEMMSEVMERSARMYDDDTDDVSVIVVRFNKVRGKGVRGEEAKMHAIVRPAYKLRKAFERAAPTLDECKLGLPHVRVQKVMDSGVSDSVIMMASLLEQDVVIKLGFEPKLPEKDNSIKVEWTMMAQSLLKSQKYTPHIVNFVGIFECDDFTRQLEQQKNENASARAIIRRIRAMKRDPDIDELHDWNKARFLVMEKAKGRTLNLFLHHLLHVKRAGATLFESAVIAVTMQIAFTLAIMYEMGIIHNDLHSSNIIVEELAQPTQFMYRVDRDKVLLLETPFVARIIDFDRSSKLSTRWDESTIENTALTNRYCPKYGQCNELVENRDWYQYLYWLENRTKIYLKGAKSELMDEMHAWIPRRIADAKIHASSASSSSPSPQTDDGSAKNKKKKKKRARIDPTGTHVAWDGVPCWCKDYNCKNCILDTRALASMKGVLYTLRGWPKFRSERHGTRVLNEEEARSIAQERDSYIYSLPSLYED